MLQISQFCARMLTAMVVCSGDITAGAVFLLCVRVTGHTGYVVMFKYNLGALHGVLAV